MSNIIEERKGFEELGKSYAPEKQTSITRDVIAGVENYWFTPNNVDGKEVIIYLHGGAFVYGSINSHSAMVSHIAKAIRRKLLFVNYSLAPEEPFPAALEDTAAVIKELAKGNSDFQYSLMGDSAGGNLAIAAALYLKQSGFVSPQYQILISPWVNMDAIYSSYIQNEKLDPILTREFLGYATSLYTTSKNLKDPLISSVYGNFDGFAPTLVLVGANEILRDDALHLHTALQNSGSTSLLKIYDKATHVWMLTNIASEEARDTFASMKEFIETTVAVEAN